MPLTHDDSTTCQWPSSHQMVGCSKSSMQQRQLKIAGMFTVLQKKEVWRLYNSLSPTHTHTRTYNFCRTAIGIRGKDGVVFGVEKLVTSKLHEAGSNKRIFTVDRHVGVVSWARQTSYTSTVKQWSPMALVMLATIDRLLWAGHLCRVSSIWGQYSDDNKGPVQYTVCYTVVYRALYPLCSTLDSVQ